MVCRKIDLNKDGQLNVLVISGTHGNETNAVRVVYDFFHDLEDLRYLGEFKLKAPRLQSVSFIQAYNKTALDCDSREFVPDCLQYETNDMNRIFFEPEYTSKDDMVKELKKAIAAADIVIDVHNSPRCLTCVSLSYDDNLPFFVNVINYINKWPELKTTPILPTIFPKSPTIKNYVNSFQDKMGFTLEFDRMGLNTNPNAAAVQREALANFVAVFGTEAFRGFKESGKIMRPYFDGTDKSQYLSKRVISIPAVEKGLVRWCRQDPLGWYEKDEPIATTVDLDKNQIVDEFKAPCSGYLVDVQDTYWAAGGEDIADFQPSLGEV